MTDYPVISDDEILTMDADALAEYARTLSRYIKWRRQYVADLTNREVEPGEYRAEFVRMKEQLVRCQSQIEENGERDSRLREIHNLKNAVDAKDGKIGMLLTHLKTTSQRITTLLHENSQLARRLKTKAKTKASAQKATTVSQSHETGSSRVETHLL